MRPGELLALRAGDVDLERGLILITKSIGEFGVGPTKTGKARTLPIMPTFETALAEQFERAEKPDGCLFHDEAGKPYRQNYLRQHVWNPAFIGLKIKAKEAGVDPIEKRKPYITRHSFASNALLEGEDIQWVRMMLGHKDLSMIFKHYSGYIKNRTRQDGSALMSKFAIQTQE